LNSSYDSNKCFIPFHAQKFKNESSFERLRSNCYIESIDFSYEFLNFDLDFETEVVSHQCSGSCSSPWFHGLPDSSSSPSSSSDVVTYAGISSKVSLGTKFGLYG
jgi:hypothetical protein